MSAPTGPGDYVECVDASPCAVYGDNGLVVGAIYSVRDIARGLVDGNTGYTADGIRLNEHRHPLGDGWFGLYRFRPIYRPKQSLLADLLTKAPTEMEPA